ncbi:calcium ion binding protein [Aureococcus anophagefferens]|nr:calcium ion binding protein [Aureococcus anophagefferens]
MVVAGANFGAADDLASVSVDMHANQGDGDGWVDLEDCAITVDHTEITGALTISSTAGGATIYVHGDNFGLTWMESSFTYGPLPDADLYSGTCSVTVKHERAACTTGPGTGSGHALKFTLWGQESVVFDAGVGYGTPYITFYENFYSSDPDRDGFLTAGGEKIVVHGGNFGADDSKIDAVTFGPSGYEYQTCDVDGAYGAPGCGCVVALDHEALECNTTAAVGMNHQWKVIIDGQHSTTPSTKTQPPSVDAIVIVGNESVAAVAAVGGGEVVRILGANFGAEQDKVEGVSYGPSGAEYAARNCTLLGDGALECLTSPGIGEELSFTVVVADQASEPGGVLSYAAPEIFAIAPAAAETAGGALLVINGTNLGLDYYMSYLEVLVDGAVVALDGAELTRATPGSSGYTYACGDGLECVALVAPPMGDAVHTCAVSVRVGSTEHPSIVLSSGEVSYEYDGPVITSLSTADGDTFGTVKCEILGHNFGASANLGSVYVNGAKIPAAQISEYGHNRIVLLYLGGVTGVLYVELGAKASDEMSFEIRSPRLVTEDSRFKPDADGYRTTGTTADGDQRFVTVAGYHFSGSMEVWVGAEEVLDGNGDQRFGVQAEIVGDLEEVDDVLTTLDIDDTCRSLTFKVPESAGAREIITVFSGGYPSYVGNTSADALYINYLPPSIDSVSATLVGTAGGDELALAGDNFGPAEDAVSLGGVACAVVSWSHTTVVVTAPPGEGAGLSLVVEAADQAASVGVGYNPPVVASVDPPSLSLTNAGGLITITGSDFGLDPVVSLPLDADRAVATSVVSHDHSTIVLSVGAGQGRNDLTIDVAGQVAIEPYAYAAPVVASSSPDEAATEGGIDGATLFSTADGSLVVSSYATDAIELLSPEGEASGPMTVVVAACGSVDDPDSCVASGEAVTFTFSPPKIYYVAVEAFDGSLLRPFAGCYVPEGETEEVCVDASCDRTAACKGATLDGCDLRTRGGAEVVLYGANFGLSLPTIVFDGAPVDAELVSHDAGHSTHALVKFVLPAGSGRDLDVVVEAGGTASAAAAFAYDPPCVTSVYPNAPDASGSVLNINGHNFGETDDAAGNVSIVIGGLECGPVVVGATTLPAWQTDGGNAYLYCATPRLTVGVKDVNITAAGQSVYYAESEAMISFSCANDHYGQVADQVYVEADGSCHEECVEDDARACAVVHLPDGNVKNCTVLTREDEYCLECPLGSMCDAWTTVYPIEPYAESGYYRLDLGDAGSTTGPRVGANECAEGYTQTKCSKCCDVSRSRNADGSKNPECWNDAKTEEMLYYRAYGECVECPTSQAWLIALLVVGAAGAGGLAYLLKKRRVEIAVLAIGVDYLQVLSVFAGTEIAWPRVLRDFYRNLAVINLDFLDIFPPECSLAMSYEQSWLAVEFAPLILAAACYLVFLVVYTYQVCANAHNRREMKKKLARLRGQLTSALLYGFYFVYLYIAENTLDVLNCARVENPDGARTEEEYLMSDPSELCWTEGETQARLYPVAIGFIFVYIFGYPLLLFWLLKSKETRSLIYDDQLLRYMHKGGHEEGLSPYLATVAKTRAKLGLLYYRFKPDMPYWIVVVVLRKMCLAITTIMFHSSASFQLATLLLILFSSLVLQMRHLPYSARKARTKIINFDGYKAHPKVTNVSAKFVFEYNTVEGLLLSCSVLICLFGVMLDSDYLEDGKHKSVREAITILTLFIISVSLAYFGAVIWHEIVSELFPFLKCTPCLENRVQVKERASTFDKNIELAEGNFNRRGARPEKVQDADLMSVEEQLQMKALLAKMQDENRALKKDLAAASKDDAKTATKVVKKKKGFANVFSSSSKTIATPTAASNPMMFKKPSATTPKPPKPAPASPKPPPAPTP